MYAIGPLLPRTYWDVVPTDEGATDIRNFLNEMQARHGENSVILVHPLAKFMSLQSDTVDGYKGVIWDLLLAARPGVC